MCTADQHHQHHCEDPSGAIPPHPATREEAVRPDSSIARAKLLAVGTGVVWAFAVWASVDHVWQTSTSVIILMGLATATVLAAIVAGAQWLEYQRKAGIAGLRQALNGDRAEQYNQDVAAVAAHLSETVETMRQVVRDEMGDVVRNHIALAYINGVRAASFGPDSAVKTLLIGDQGRVNGRPHDARSPRVPPN